MIFENLINTNLTVTDDIKLDSNTTYTIATSKLQTSTYDASIPFIESNVSTVIIDGSITPNEYSESYASNIDLIAYWEHDGVNLTVALVAEGLGFIAMGLGSETMNGANIIVGGYNGTSGTSYCLDTVGVSGYSNPISLDSNNNIIKCDASENTLTTSTTLEFKIPMNSGDSDDNIMETNSTYNFFFAFHESLDDIFDPAIGNHNGMPHSNPNRLVFFRPLLEVYDTQISLVTPLEINQGDNLTLKTILVDENQIPLKNMNVNFYRETDVGNLIIGNSTTDSNGTAEFIYTSNLLRGEVTFGVIFNELIGRIGSVDTILRKSETFSTVTFNYSETDDAEVRDVFFLPLQSECCEGGVFYLLLIRDFMFYSVLLSIWGIYFFNIFTILRLRFVKPKHKEENLMKNDLEAT